MKTLKIILTTLLITACLNDATFAMKDNNNKITLSSTRKKSKRKREKIEIPNNINNNEESPAKKRKLNSMSIVKTTAPFILPPLYYLTWGVELGLGAISVPCGFLVLQTLWNGFKMVKSHWPFSSRQQLHDQSESNNEQPLNLTKVDENTIKEQILQLHKDLKTYNTICENQNALVDKENFFNKDLISESIKLKQNLFSKIQQNLFQLQQLCLQNTERKIEEINEQKETSNSSMLENFKKSFSSLFTKKNALTLSTKDQEEKNQTAQEEITNLQNVFSEFIKGTSNSESAFSKNLEEDLNNFLNNNQNNSTDLEEKEQNNSFDFIEE